MASLENQQTWMPYESTKDCSQGFCSLYCPQWCYIIFPPPPPFGPPDEDSGVNFSPLVIAIIGILASAFVLVSYYTIVSKYCANAEAMQRRARRSRDEEYDAGGLQHESWQAGASGLDDAMIKSIAVFKYQRGDGMVEGTDCSVCLSEFQDNESLRLLPKCSHAFHVPCIDTWLKSHSNCPLCRASIVSTSSLPLQLPPPVQESVPIQESLTESQQNNHTILPAEDIGSGPEESSTGRGSRVVSKPPFRALSDMGGLQRDTVIEIQDEEIQSFRRSFSMDSSHQGRVSIADVLGMNMEEDNQADHQLPTGIRSSKRLGGEHSKGSNKRSRVLHGVISPIAMKRSSSSGRFLLTRHGRGRNASISILN